MANEQELVTINVDGQDIRVPKGVMLVEAAKVVDVDIPVFCYHPKLDPVGMCRMCLVEMGSPGKNKDGTPEVDEEGRPIIRWMPKLVTACTTPATEGTHIRTANDRVADAWRGTLEFLLTSHPLDCPVCDKGGECPLQDLTMAYGPDLSRFYKRNKYHFQKPVPLGDLVVLDQERCIYCARCIRFQEEIAGDPVLKFADRNRGQEIVTFSDPPFDSYYSGNVTDVCPVGALTSADFRLKARVWELDNRPSVCNHCPVGCNTVLGTRTDDIKRIMPRQNEWVNELWICDKGRFGHHFNRAEDRLTTPLIRESSGDYRAATWNEALHLIANRFAEILGSTGPGAIGGIGGDRLPNEDLYLFGRFMRDVIGTNNIDHRLRWPVGSGIEEALLNVGLTSGSNLGQLGKGSVILTIGADLEEEQPVAYLRARGAVRQGAQLLVVQSRTTKEMKDASQVVLVRPGGEAAIAAAILKGILGQSSADLGKLGGAQELATSVNELDDNELSKQSAVDSESISGLVSAIAGAENLVVMLGREAVESAGTNSAALVDALVGLLVATGKAGQLNSGLIALWPHNNSQGAADMGILPNFAAGYEPVASPGATMDQMFNGEAGLRAAYVVGSDPAGDRRASRTVLESLEFLVVQDLFMTETARLADVILPAASYAERDGTFTNMERRVQRFEKGLEPTGDSLPDWAIITRLAALFEAGWPEYFVAADIAAEIAKKVKLYKGFTYDKLRGEAASWSTTAAGHHIFTGTSVMNNWYGQQWDVAAQAKKPKFDLRWSGLTMTDITQGGLIRVVGQRQLYDQGTMISHSHILDGRRALPFVKLSAQDADTLGVHDGQMVTIASSDAELTAPLVVDSRLQAGVVVVPVGVSDGTLDSFVGAGSSAPTVTVRKAVAEFA